MSGDFESRGSAFAIFLGAVIIKTVSVNEGAGGAGGSPFYFYTAVASCFESAGFIRDARGHV